MCKSNNKTLESNIREDRNYHLCQEKINSYEIQTPKWNITMWSEQEMENPTSKELSLNFKT
jgi:hypothetical protein